MRTFFLVFVVLAGIGLMWLLYVEKPKTPLDATLAPAYQLLGEAPQSLSRMLSKIVPVNDLDEKEFGDALAQRFECLADKKDKDYLYLNDIMRRLQTTARKPFNYRVYVYPSPYPNACALPGGVVLATKGLLSTLKSESEVVSVLSHEMGHVELSHCSEIVRFELLSRKIGTITLGRLADFAVNVLLRHFYSKTHEDEADNYGYEMLLNTMYDPTAAEKAFRRLLKDSTVSRSRTKTSPRDPISEYFMTHPYLELRAQKFGEKARVWWATHEMEKRYAGVRNLNDRVPYATRQFSDEWVNAYKYK